MASKRYPFSRLAAALLGLSLSIQAAVAGVMPSHSRMIYPQDSPFQSLLLVNTNHFPVVVQLWVNEGETDAGPERTDAPFYPPPPCLNSIQASSKSSRYSIPSPSG